MTVPKTCIPRPRHARPQGAALVFVLAALALISFLAIAILTLIRSEDRGTRTAADLTELRLLAELPEKIVISQIRRATNDLGTSYTWASQPGMIRVFDNVSNNGQRPQAYELFKLYSAPVMTLGTGANPLEDAETLMNWPSQPGVFTDLNEPIRVLPVRQQGQLQDYTDPTLIYPILDAEVFPQGSTTGLYDGLKISGSTPPATPGSPLPMPVAWLYVLKNGKISSASAAGQGKVRVQDATADNPVVGRIAFWADDESCKLNLNTATEPAPWDAPHTRTTTDEAYAQTIPAKGEYYRMPGHPAYTSLAPVLRKFGTGATTAATAAKQEPQDTFSQGGDWWSHLQDYHRLAPRTIDTRNSQTGTQGGTTTATDQVPLKQERFYGTVDEFFFNTEREANGEVSSTLRFTQEDVRKARFFLTTHSRAPELNPFNRPKISLWPVQQNTSQRNETDKALAAASTLGDDAYYFQRASEWTGLASPGSSQDQDADMAVQRNNEMFGYLQDLTERDIPGFGGSFAGTSNGKLGPDSRDQLLASMFDLIRWGVNPATPYQQAITPALNPQYTFLAPGYGQPGAADGIGGWTALPMRVQGVGESVNAIDLPEGQSPPSSSWAKGYGRYPTITEVAVVFTATDADRDATGVIDAAPANEFGDRTKSFTAFVVVEPWLPAPGPPSVAPAYEIRFENLDALTVTEESSTENYSLGFPESVSNYVTFSPTREPNGLTGHPLGGGHSSYAGFASQFFTPDGDVKKLPPPPPQDPDNALHYRFMGAEIQFALPSEGREGTKLTFSSGSAVIKLSILDIRTGTVVQTLHLQFPECHMPMPLVHKDDLTKVNPTALHHQMETRFTPTAENVPGAPAQMTQLFLRGDVIRSLEVFGEPERQYPLPIIGSVTAPPVKGITRGDMRLLANRVVAQEPQTVNGVNHHWFAPHPLYFESTLNIPNSPPDAAFKAHSLRDGAVMFTPQPGGQPTVATAGRLVGRGQPGSVKTLEPLFDPPNKLGSIPATPLGTDGAFNLDDRPGDFNTGPGIIEDGPYVSLSDFNNGFNQSTARPASTTPTTAGWFERGGVFGEENGVTYQPWRQASSGFIFGSLPTGVYGHGFDPTPRPWQTLLLCPNPPSRTTTPDQEPKWNTTTSTDRDHFGFSSPRDHLWLEFFRLPVTEPAGFGDAVSTEGKVNMNYQLMPFTWIKRATAMHGALHGVRVTAIPSTAVGINAGTEHYKKPDGTPSTLQFRYGVDAEKTLEAFEEQRFKLGDVFRSPSEICDVWLVPKRLEGHTYAAGSVNPAVPPTSYTALLDWWEGADKTSPTDGFEATGDNLREAPYAQLYPRLCTKSNVFTVHYRVQLLKKSRSTEPAEWDERRDNVIAEHRGQTTLERYLDLNKTTIPDFVTTINESEALDDYYNVRVVNRRDFKP